MTAESKNKLRSFPRVGRFIITFFFIALIITAAIGYKLYTYIFNENVKTRHIIILPKGSTFNQVVDTLKINDVLINYKAFAWVAKKKKYPENIKHGRYLLTPGMNSNEIVNILRAGIQEPVNMTFNNVRFKEELAGKVSHYIEADSASILSLFSDYKKIEQFGFTPETFNAMFIPNTYEFLWTTTAEEFANRMKNEFDRFWNEGRKMKAQKLGLAPVEVAILASIVREETNKSDELRRIAGVYLNRLERGIPLQADPTVKFATGNRALNRILNSHIEIDSPYNTYLYPGLPPGPINFPDIKAIEAVLNFEKHNFIYMCAREDFSGYHNFASTLAEHNRNAKKYRAALDKEKIFK